MSCVLIVSCMCRLVWPDAKIFLCLWHVQKAWTENAIKKSPRTENVLPFYRWLGIYIMYGKGIDIDDDSVDCTLQQLGSSAKGMYSPILRHKESESVKTFPLSLYIVIMRGLTSVDLC